MKTSPAKVFDLAKRKSPCAKGSKGTMTIPTPVYRRTGDAISTITVKNGGNLSGVYVLKTRGRHLGLLHVFRTNEDMRLFGYLTGYFGDRYHIKSITPDFPSGWYKVALVGCVLEHYPNGLDGERWVLWGGLPDDEAACSTPAADVGNKTPPATVIDFTTRRVKSTRRATGKVRREAATPDPTPRAAR